MAAMTSDHDALLAAVLADPVADLPRLIYADFLQDRGTSVDVARAEFIRIQVESASACGPRLQELAAHEARLLALHGRAWLWPLRAKGEALQNRGTHGLFRRGFVEIVWMPATIFCWKAERLFRKAPATELRVTRADLAEFHELLRTPETGRLHVLDLSDRRLGDDALRLLAASALWRSLKVVRLRNCGITEAGILHLLDEAPDVGRPDRLEFAFNAVGDDVRTAASARFGAGLVWA